MVSLSRIQQLFDQKRISFNILIYVIDSWYLLVLHLIILFVHFRKLTTSDMEQTDEGLTSNLKCEKENSELDIEGTVIKIELKPPLTQTQKLPNERLENANQIKSENQAQNEPSQNALLIEDKIDIKLENEETKSYICGKQLNSNEESSAMKKSSSRKVKVQEKNICEICWKTFSEIRFLKLHVKTVHGEVKEHTCNIP